MQIEIDNKIYDVEIIKKNNRNTYVRVKHGKIVVTTNYLCSKNSIIKLIMDNKKSIIEMIDKDSKKTDKNDNFYYFGKKYDVIYGFKDIDIVDNKIYVYDKKSLYIGRKGGTGESLGEESFGVRPIIYLSPDVKINKRGYTIFLYYSYKILNKG